MKKEVRFLTVVNMKVSYHDGIFKFEDADEAVLFMKMANKAYSSEGDEVKITMHQEKIEKEGEENEQ